MKRSKVDFSRFVNSIISIDDIRILVEHSLPVPKVIKNNTPRYGEFLYKNHKARFDMLYLLWYSGNFTKGLLFTSNDRLLKKIEPINSLMEKAYAAQLFGNKKEWYDGRPNYR